MRSVVLFTMLMGSFVGANTAWAQGAPEPTPGEVGPDPAAPPATEPAAPMEPTAPAQPPPPPPPPPGAQAAPPPATAGYYEPPPPTAPMERTGARLHDGFYLRLSLGGGSLRADGEVDVAGTTSEYALQGGAAAFDIMIGGSPADGLVIGGAYFFNSASNPEFEPDGGEAVETDGTMSFGLVGPFIDGFFDPEGGFHLGGAIGVAATTFTDDNTDADESYTGGGASLFLGYDFWIADEWSLGGLLRFTGARVTNTDDNRDETLSMGSVALLFTGLYH